MSGVSRTQPTLGAAGHHWGNFASASALPNVGADGLDVRPGDLAAVGTNLYICYSAASGAAVWYGVGVGNGNAPTRVFNAPHTGIGQNTVLAGATTLYYGEIYIPGRMTVDHAHVMMGATVGTDKLRAFLYDETGAWLAESAVAGVDTSGPNDWLQIDYETPPTVDPGRYFVGIMGNGSTDSIDTVGAAFPYGLCEAEGGHAFAETGVSIISLATGFTANQAPVVYLHE